MKLIDSPYFEKSSEQIAVVRQLPDGSTVYAIRTSPDGLGVVWIIYANGRTMFCGIYDLDHAKVEYLPADDGWTISDHTFLSLSAKMRGG